MKNKQLPGFRFVEDPIAAMQFRMEQDGPDGA